MWNQHAILHLGFFAGLVVLIVVAACLVAGCAAAPKQSEANVEMAVSMEDINAFIQRFIQNQARSLGYHQPRTLDLLLQFITFFENIIRGFFSYFG